MQRFIRKFKAALAGIWYALRWDRSFQFNVLVVTPATLIIAFLLRPLSETEVLLLGLALTLIFTTEFQNSSLEEALDHLHPELHDRVGRSKDLAAGAVLASGVFLGFTLLVMLAERFLS